MCRADHGKNPEPAARRRPARAKETEGALGRRLRGQRGHRRQSSLVGAQADAVREEDDGRFVVGGDRGEYVGCRETRPGRRRPGRGARSLRGPRAETARVSAPSTPFVAEVGPDDQESGVVAVRGRAPAHREDRVASAERAEREPPVGVSLP